jgi:beta-N-acetylhexosaminidase
MAIMNEQDLDEKKRLARRQRRKRSQLIAFILLVLFLVIVVSLAVFGIHKLRVYLAANRPVEVVETQTDPAAEGQDNITIETPTESEDMPVQEYTSEDIMTEVVEGCIAEMPLEDKVAGLFITTPEQLTGVETAVKAGSGTKDALANYAVGGIVYSAKNVKSDDQIKEMLETTASMSKYPIFTVLSDKAVNNETVKATLAYEIPEEIKDDEQAGKVSSAIGSQLYKYGFNLVLSPEIGTLEDGDMASAYAQGLKESGVTACSYRFPIMGETSEAPDSNDITKDELVMNEYEYIKPSLNDGNLGAVQVSNISLPQLTGDDTPACLSSKVVEEELRGTLGFEGIVISAPLSEGAVTQNYMSAEAAIKAVKAGCDMLFLPENFEEAYEGLLSEVRDGSISEERINESLRRIYRIKYADKVNQISQSN